MIQMYLSFSIICKATTVTHTKRIPKSGTAAFLPGTRCAEELQGTHPEHKNKSSVMKLEIVPIPSWRYKTTSANLCEPCSYKRQQQTTISIKTHGISFPLTNLINNHHDFSV